jgi:hypothetical protein
LSVGRLDGEDRGLRGDSGLGYDDSGKAPDEIGPGRGQRLHDGQLVRGCPARPDQTTDERVAHLAAADHDETCHGADLNTRRAIAR